MQADVTLFWRCCCCCSHIWHYIYIYIYIYNFTNILYVIFPQITRTLSANPSSLISHTMYDNDPLRHCISFPPPQPTTSTLRSSMTNPPQRSPHTSQCMCTPYRNLTLAPLTVTNRPQYVTEILTSNHDEQLR